MTYLWTSKYINVGYFQNTGTSVNYSLCSTHVVLFPASFYGNKNFKRSRLRLISLCSTVLSCGSLPRKPLSEETHTWSLERVSGTSWEEWLTEAEDSSLPVPCEQWPSPARLTGIWLRVCAWVQASWLSGILLSASALVRGSCIHLCSTSAASFYDGDNNTSKVRS